MKDSLKKERDFYNEHRDEYKQKYLGKDLVICGDKLQGVFDDFESAYDFVVQNNYCPNEFMIKKVTEKEQVLHLFPRVCNV